MSSKGSKTPRSLSRTQRTSDAADKGSITTGLAPSTVVHRRRKSDEVNRSGEVITMEWPQCLVRRPNEVYNIAYHFSKFELTDRPVEQSVFKEVLKILTGVIAKGTILVETGVYHLVTTTREVLRIPHRKLVEYIRQQFAQFAVQPG